MTTNAATFPDYNYMKAVRILAEGSAKSPAIRERAGVDRMSSALESLEEAGYAEKTPDIDRPHEYVWSLTEEGEEKIRERSAMWQEAERRLEVDDV